MPVAAVSFGIYLWHPVVASALIGMIWNRLLGPAGLVSFPVILGIAMISSVVIAMLSAHLFENPLRNAILGWAGMRGKTHKHQAPSVAPAE